MLHISEIYLSEDFRRSPVTGFRKQPSLAASRLIRQRHESALQSRSRRLVRPPLSRDCDRRNPSSTGRDPSSRNRRSPASVAWPTNPIFAVTPNLPHVRSCESSRAGSWRWIYLVSAMLALYLNVFVLASSPEVIRHVRSTGRSERSTSPIQMAGTTFAIRAVRSTASLRLPPFATNCGFGPISR
jgi:hypothetical protein